MVGRRNGKQASVFYEFRLNDRIPKNHLLRRIDVFVTAALADVHEQLDPYSSEIGRPSVDPELMIRMLIVGFAHLKTHHGFGACGSGGFPVRATSSISPPSCRTSKPLRSESSGYHWNGRLR